MITDATTAAPARTPPDSFDEFFGVAWPRLYRTAYAVAGDHGAAEDALQNAFAKVYSRWRRITRLEHPEAYVRRMVVNEILSQRRRAYRRRERPRADVIGDIRAAAVVDTTGDLVTDRAMVWTAVQALPPRQRAVVVLRYYEDLSEREIAETLGCTPGTVKSQASSALSNLRRMAGHLDPGDLR